MKNNIPTPSQIYDLASDYIYECNQVPEQANEKIYNYCERYLFTGQHLKELTDFFTNRK